MTSRARRSLATAAAAALFLCLGASGPASADDPSPVVVHLGHFTDDLHGASMALGIATMLQQRDVPVTLFLDREGVRLADARVPNDLRWGGGRSIADAYAGFVKAGGQVLLCPHCAQAAGITAKDLRKGAVIGTDEAVAEAFVSASKVIDY